MFGILMAFKDYSIVTGIQGIFTSDWVGFRYFVEFYRDYKFYDIVRNTLVLSFLKVVFTFPVPDLICHHVKRSEAYGLQKSRANG